MNISVDTVIILSGQLTVLSSVVSYFLIRLIRSNDDFRVLYVISNEINEIKYNYLDRFDKVKNQIMESELRIISNISGQFRGK